MVLLVSGSSLNDIVSNPTVGCLAVSAIVPRSSRNQGLRAAEAALAAKGRG